MRLFLSSIAFSLLVACTAREKNENTAISDFNEEIDSIEIDSAQHFEEIPEIKPDPYIIDTLEQQLIDAGLVNIQEIRSEIHIDVRYSDTNNFMKKDMYGHLNRIYLQPSVAADLAKSQDALKAINSNLTLLVYDGVRPRSVQQYMWDILDLPINEKVKFVSNPKNGSVHNYGAAVDLTIADTNGIPLDMGAGYDDARKIAYPRHEQAYLDSGMLSLEQIENRELLRKVMKSGGFWGIQTEWWHFNRYSRNRCKELFEIVE